MTNKIKNPYSRHEIFLDLGEAINKFKHILSYDRRQFPYTTEATIQIFKSTFELYWKLLKKICREEGIEVNSPRATLQQAYILRLINNEKIWLEIMESRNLTSHTYKQPVANSIYEQCKIYLPVMEENYLQLKEKFNL